MLFLKMLQDIAEHSSNCVVNRVFEKGDADKKPVLYVHVDIPEEGRIFYYVDKDKGEFVQLPEEEFTQRFECYSMDLQRANGHRPWKTESIEQQEIKILPSDVEAR